MISPDSITAVLLLQVGDGLNNPLIPVVLMVVIFYLVLFLPMRRRQRRHDELVAGLKTGDVVATNAGLVGTIVGLSDRTVTLRVKPDNVKLEFARGAVSGLAEDSTEG